jgi:predicted lysophospholipase L1 biosynthesis ABC-type transport system permease subunit
MTAGGQHDQRHVTIFALQTHAIGVRLALGAKGSDIVGSVCRGPAIAIAAGSVLGLAVAFMLARLARGLFFGVQPLDLAGVAVSLGCILSIALCAAIVPIVRALLTDPIAVLRSE